MYVASAALLALTVSRISSSCQSVLQAVARPILRRLEVRLLHEVHEDFGRAVLPLPNELDLHKHFSGALEVTLQEVLEPLVEHVEEGLRVALAHLDQVLVRLEQQGHVDLPQHDRLLKGVPVQPGLNSGRALLLFIQVALLWLQSKVVHFQIAGVQGSHFGVAFENDAVNLTAFGLACVCEEVVKLASEQDHGAIRLGLLLQLVRHIHIGS